MTGIPWWVWALFALACCIVAGLLVLAKISSAFLDANEKRKEQEGIEEDPLQ